MRDAVIAAVREDRPAHRSAPLVVDGEHCVAILDIDTTFGPIPFAEHIHVVNGQILSVRGYCDPRPMLAGRA